MEALLFLNTLILGYIAYRLTKKEPIDPYRFDPEFPVYSQDSITMARRQAWNLEEMLPKEGEVLQTEIESAAAEQNPDEEFVITTAVTTAASHLLSHRFKADRKRNEYIFMIENNYAVRMGKKISDVERDFSSEFFSLKDLDKQDKALKDYLKHLASTKAGRYR